MSTQEAVVIFPTFKEGKYGHFQKYVALGHVTVFKGPFKHLTKPFLNGIGGKMNEGESPEDAAMREFNEEVTLHNGDDPLKDLVQIGEVEVWFYKKGEKISPKKKRDPDVRLYVFRMYLKERMEIVPKGDSPEFGSFAWYPIREITYPNIGPDGAELLPSDRFWLPFFLIGKGRRTAKLEINRQFRVHEIGKGDNYRSGRMIISRELPHPSEE
tara:strand:+ start:281 stop:919 length:639 start_codon:yes stop_codon:yes gene_type:complete